jgi:capsular exopolysaccharide synthesis family protein
LNGTFDTAAGRVRYWHALRSHRVLIAAVTLIALLAALLVVTTATKRYDASADLAIHPWATFATGTSDWTQGLDGFRQPADLSSASVLAAREFSSSAYLDKFRKEEKRRAFNDAQASITVTPLSQADIVSIGVSAPKATLAKGVADRFASFVLAERRSAFQKSLTQKIAQVQGLINQVPGQNRAQNPVYDQFAATLAQMKLVRGRGDPTVALFTGATVPTAPSWPRPKTTLAIALAVGLLLGVAAALTLEIVNPRFGREDDLTQAHRLPVLARMPRLPTHAVRNYFLGRDSLPPDAWKAYRTLRAVLSNAGANGDRFPASILVTSAGPGDGKTLTAVNLAIALSSAGLRVTLVDADLPRPMIGTIFNIIGHRDGVVHLLNNPTAADSGAVEAPLHARLKLLLASEEQMHELHLFDAKRVKKLIDRLAKESDVVVVDSAPLPEVAEAVALADACEAVVVCVRIGHTRRDKLGELRELLGRRGVVPLGFFVTSRRRPRRKDERAYKGYPGELPLIPGDYLLRSASEPARSADRS